MRFQSTHPRGVRHPVRLDDVLVLAVSIHAPARGATEDDELTQLDVEFQSTHPRGVRLGRRGYAMRGASFNPRTREGCDNRSGNYSIYTVKFQSTHPRGVRHTYKEKRSVEDMFQSTHPRGVRRSKTAMWSLRTSCFNPRTREGCDFIRPTSSFTHGVFQSTHPRGVRRCSSSCGSPGCGFNPRTREGCDLSVQIVDGDISLCFNPRTREGCDGRDHGVRAAAGGFNPRTREGCDAWSC